MTGREVALAAALVGGGLLWAYTAGQHRQHDTAAVQQAAAQHHADSARADTAVRQFAAAVQQSDSLRQRLRRHQALDAREATATQQAVQTADSARAHAERTLADSAATVDSFRSALASVIASSRAADSARTAEEARQAALLAEALRVVAEDSTALQRGVAAQNAALQRAVAAEREVSALQSARPSAFGNAVRLVVVGLAGVEVGRLVR